MNQRSARRFELGASDGSLNVGVLASACDDVDVFTGRSQLCGDDILGTDQRAGSYRDAAFCDPDGANTSPTRSYDHECHDREVNVSLSQSAFRGFEHPTGGTTHLCSRALLRDGYLRAIRARGGGLIIADSSLVRGARAPYSSTRRGLEPTIRALRGGQDRRRLSSSLGAPQGKRDSKH